MDEHIISLICAKLSYQDLARFAMTHKTAYCYCKRTNIHKRRCNENHYCPYHFDQTILEYAKLDHCMKATKIVQELSQHKVPLQQCAYHISLTKSCGTVVYIVIGREVIINNVVYAFSLIDVIYDDAKYCNNMRQYKQYQVLSIEANMKRLRHKFNSIIIKRYTSIDIKTVINPQREIHRPLCESLRQCVDQYIIKCLRIS